MILKKLLLIIIFLGVFTIGSAYTEIEINAYEEYANLRAKPSKNSKIITRIGNFYSAVILKKSGDWYYVEYMQERGKFVHGYVHKSQGHLVEVYEIASKDGYANIRWEPSFNGEIVTTIENGRLVHAYEEDEKWIYIAFDASPHAPVAYIHKSQVKKAKYDRNNY